MLLIVPYLDAVTDGKCAFNDLRLQNGGHVSQIGDPRAPALFPELRILKELPVVLFGSADSTELRSSLKDLVSSVDCWTRKFQTVR